MIARRGNAMKTVLAGVMSLLLGAGVLGLFAAPALADSAPLNPADPGTPTTVTADPLPTAQVDGVVWAQTVVGNAVYAVGKFSTARPAGAAAGTQEVARHNVLAYDIATGALLPGFSHDLNAQALDVVASPDGSRIYVSGDFTSVDGQPRYRIAAFSTATGALIDNFAPAPDAEVRGIAATNSTVYIGGSFSAVGSVARHHLAAVSASDGSLLPWAPVPGPGSTAGNNYPPKGNPENQQLDDDVMALVLTNANSQVVASGHFDTLNGSRSTGIGALDPVTGATRPFAAGQQITNQGINSAIFSLSTDGTTVWGTSYDFYGPGNIEGAFAVKADGGIVQWVDDCHGDTYSSYAMAGVLYVAGHPHICSNIGGYPQSDPRHALAFSLTPTGVVGTGTLHTGFPAGQPAPSLLPWYPDIAAGTYTGQYQGAWSVTGNGQYVAYGGEFPTVNGTGQQGLVRFALRSIAPNKVGPAWTSDLTPTVTTLSDGSVRVSWRATSDADNENLTYEVYRDSSSVPPVYQATQASTWWNRPTMAFFDSGVPAGTHSYRVVAVDPFGNMTTDQTTSVTVTATKPAADRAYEDRVRADGASDYWPLGESSGTKAYDYAGGSDMTIASGVTPGQKGALAGDPNTSFKFNGSTGSLGTTTSQPGPNTFSEEAWFQTTSGAGGKIIGFGDKSSGLSSNYDRHVYMDTSGRLNFGVYTGSTQIVRSTAAYNDGKWHHVVATLGSGGLALYVDGNRVGSRADVTAGQAYNGYWRVGGDNMTGWTGANFFAGLIDEVAIYPTVLSADQVLNHYKLGSTGTGINLKPVAKASASVRDLTASVDGTASSDPDGSIAGYAWDFGDGATATGATTTHTYAAAGTYTVTLTVTDDRGATGTTTTSVTVTAPPPNQPPTAAFTSTATGLAAAFDGSGSADPDGRVASYAWDFGDSGTGTGPTPTHTYAQGGTYTVTLTVTDDDGGTNSVSHAVAVAPLTVYATDGFGRTVANGFGNADRGGTWSVNDTSNTSVGNGTGHLWIPAGWTTMAFLDGLNQSDVALQTALTMPAAATGGGEFASVVARHVGSSDYRVVVRFTVGGSVELSLMRIDAGDQTTLQSTTLPGTYAPGRKLLVRLDVSGSGSTTLHAKAWPAGSTEPASWQLTAADADAQLQRPGGVGVSVYTSSTATTAGRVDVDDVWAGPAGQAPTDGGQPVNQAPTAAFTTATTGLVVSLDGSTSSDVDGTVASWAWDFGDGTTGTEATASHTYAAAGTYPVQLTVTDDKGAVGTLQKSVTVTDTPATNQAPTAAFTSSAQGLTVAVDGTGSSDPDGTVASYAWDFGDGTTGSGSAAAHTYGTAGTYTVRLTVTDNGGVTATVTHAVTVTSAGASAALAVDGFTRTVNGGWGNADTGGTWTTSGNTSVDGKAGLLNAAPGTGETALLSGVSAQDVVVQADVLLPEAPTGNGIYFNLDTRWVSDSSYRLKLWFLPSGQVQVMLLRVENGNETILAGYNLDGTYVPGSTLRILFQTSGSGTTTLQAKVWSATGTEPAAWGISATDSTAALQRPGALFIEEYNSGAATGSTTVGLDNIWAGPAGTRPQQQF